MSQNGNTQNNLAIQKKNLLNQKIGATNYSNLEFSHVASIGDEVINFNSLVADSSLVSLEGFSNPTPSQLIAGKITQNKGNVFLHSSARGQLMRGQEFYIREDNQIRLTYEAEEDEIFHGMINNVVRTVPALLDVKKISFTGELAEGSTDVVVGSEYNINANPTTQLGDLVVYRWQGVGIPKLMLRCEGNDLSNDGDYIEKLSVIEFKEEGIVGGEDIAVFSPNCIPVEFQGSFKTDLETLGGQVDLISEFLQDVHSLPTNPFQGSPNQIDLRAFGQKVLDLERLYTTTVDTALSESIGYTGYISKNGSNFVKLRNAITNTGSLLLSTDNTGDRTVITFLQDCEFSASWASVLGGSNDVITMSLYTSGDVERIKASQDVNTFSAGGVSISIKANAGDYLVVGANSGLTPQDTVDTHFSVIANKVTAVTLGSLIP